MTTNSERALAGIKVIEVGSGAAAGYCARLLADAGADVTRITTNGSDDYARGPAEEELLYAAYLSAGKARLPMPPRNDFESLCRNADIVIVGEDTKADLPNLGARYCVVELSWFGRTGPHADWKGCDLVIEALTGMPHLAGPREGPPIHGGDRQATVIGGVSAYIAAVAALAGGVRDKAQNFEISILEANIAISEMDIHFVERDGLPLQRHGLNRFSPNGPVGIYRCKDGWLGVIATTPDQWLSLCTVLGLDDLKADATLATRELRFQRLDEVEMAMTTALAKHTPEEWAELGRRHRVPMVPVPNAAGILNHPIFQSRKSLANFRYDGREFQIPRAPFGLTTTPTALRLDEIAIAPSGDRIKSRSGAFDDPPLAGLTIVDFAMGWAGPLASRLLADLGADVIKIEAGRYPDWWRGVNWTPQYIAEKSYENAKGFCALNRGKKGVSLDLTTESGRNIALDLIANADAVVENQAAGVMAKLGLGYEDMKRVNPEIVLLSMSAFGTGNAWSDTRAYGSTLEQGSGLPSFTGFPEMPPTMAHLAYGDPVGGLFGCAAVLTAIAYKKRSGKGQYVNLSMVEAMLQFTAPALLELQSASREPLRRGNAHAVFAPHGIYPAAGEDRWVAIAATDDESFRKLAALIGQPDWIARADYASASSRRTHASALDAGIAAWTRLHDPHEAALKLQNAGVSAAPVVHTEEIVSDPHLVERDFFIDLDRDISGPQRQAGIAIKQNGRRLGSRAPAPLLGEHSYEMLRRYANIERGAVDRLVAEGIVTFEPKAIRTRSVA